MDTIAVSSSGENTGTASVNDVETSVPGISVVQVAIPNQPVQVLVEEIWRYFTENWLSMYWSPISYDTFATMLKSWRERGTVASSVTNSFNVTFRNYVLELWTNDISHATMLEFTLRRKNIGKRSVF